jgi:hypothetical protein
LTGTRARLLPKSRKIAHQESGLRINRLDPRSHGAGHGGAEYPLSEIPLQGIVDRVADGTYKAKPARVFKFQEIREAHRLMESGQANGKIVIGV